MEKKNAIFGFIGMGLGAIALLLALVHFWAGPFSTHQPSLEQTVAEKAVSIKEATIAALKGEELNIPNRKRTKSTDEIISIATAVLGGLAIILGVFGFAKRESSRVTGGAALLGAGAITFQFATFALGAIVFAIILAAVIGSIMSGLGLDIG